MKYDQITTLILLLTKILILVLTTLLCSDLTTTSTKHLMKFIAKNCVRNVALERNTDC